MSVLVDRELLSEGHRLISPFRHSKVQPNSVDLTLGDEFMTIISPVIDVKEPVETVSFVSKAIVIEPHDFLLATTKEVVRVPNGMLARVEGKSSLGRIGLAVHCTAGFIDTGFKGNITLELSNLTNSKIKLYSGMDICQICFERCNDARELYSGKYYNQEGVTASKIHENFKGGF